MPCSLAAILSQQLRRRLRDGATRAQLPPVLSAAASARGASAGRSLCTRIPSLALLLENAQGPQKLFSVRNREDPPQNEASDPVYLTTHQTG